MMAGHQKNEKKQGRQCTVVENDHSLRKNAILQFPVGDMLG
jgi:hypothetical protein